MVAFTFLVIVLVVCYALYRTFTSYFVSQRAASGKLYIYVARPFQKYTYLTEEHRFNSNNSKAAPLAVIPLNSADFEAEVKVARQRAKAKAKILNRRLF